MDEVLEKIKETLWAYRDSWSGTCLLSRCSLCSVWIRSGLPRYERLEVLGIIFTDTEFCCPKKNNLDLFKQYYCEVGTTNGQKIGCPQLSSIWSGGTFNLCTKRRKSGRPQLNILPLSTKENGLVSLNLWLSWDEGAVFHYGGRMWLQTTDLLKPIASMLRLSRSLPWMGALHGALVTTIQNWSDKCLQLGHQAGQSSKRRY